MESWAKDLWWWLAALVTGVAAWFCKRVDGRIFRLEKDGVTRDELVRHMRDEREHFNLLHQKNDEAMKILSTVRETVARSEGMLSRMNGNSTGR